MESRLGILMDNFSISGKDLARLLHIDRSLVSKWRSGKRHLKPNSVYTSQIIRHVMALDSHSQYAKIRLLLSQDYLNVFKCTEQELALFLKDWLTAAGAVREGPRAGLDEIKSLRNAARLTVYALSGPGGRRQAVQFMLKYAQNISPGAEIWCYTTENSRWLYENAEFFGEWCTRHMTFLGEDNRIRVIHPLTGSYEGLASSVLTWMPMHMTGRTTAYFIPKSRDEQLVSTYFLVKNHLALFNWSTRQSAREMNTYITHEPQVVRDIEVMLQCHFDESTRLFEQFTYESKDEYLNSMIAVMERDDREYRWSLSFPLHGLPEPLARLMLAEAGISGREAEQNLEILGLLAELSAKSPRCFFIDLEHLEERLGRGEVLLADVSFACGRDVRVSRATYIRLVREALRTIMESDKVRVCLATTDLLRKLGDAEVIAKENTRVVFSGAQGGRPRVLMAREPSVVAAIHGYFEELWNTTPYICRNKEYVARQISKLLDEAERLGGAG